MAAERPRSNRISSDVFRRNADGNWVLHPIAEGGQLEIEYRDFRCPLEAVYEDVAFDRGKPHLGGNPGYGLRNGVPARPSVLAILIAIQKSHPPMTTTPEAFRAHAMEHGLSSEELDPNPIRQFQCWYEGAFDTGIPEPNGMSLATVSDDGQPWLRTVLLKLYDEQGFVFFTNYESSKSRQIAEHPEVALLFPWVALARQVQITGTASRVSTAESLKYFATRARGSQIGAWASHQSRVITSRSLLEAKVSEIKRKFSDGAIPLPDFWGGFRVVPVSIEFWQGRANRLHDRFRYTRTAQGDWRIDRLAP